MVQQGAEKMVIRRNQVRKIRHMLKKLPFEVMECGFDDLCDMGSGVVTKEYGSTLPMGLVSLNRVFHAVIWHVAFLSNLVNSSAPVSLNAGTMRNSFSVAIRYKQRCL